jgi:hypothetical protein
MTTEQPTPAVYETGAARYALSSGIASVVLAILYMTPWVGAFVLYGSIFFGIVGVVFGILALKRRQPKGMAVTGLVLGALSILFGVAVLLFALAFVGVFMAESPYS